MTRNDLDAIQARADAATDAPWHPYNHGTWIGGATGVVPAPVVSRIYSSADAEFIANARSDIPALIAEIRELRAGRSHVDNPVQNDPESFAVDNATRLDDPTDDAGYAEQLSVRHFHHIAGCKLHANHDGACDA